MVTLTDISCLQQVKKFNTNTRTHARAHAHTHYLHHHHDKGSKLVSTSHETLAISSSLHTYIQTHAHTYKWYLYIIQTITIKIIINMWKEGQQIIFWRSLAYHPHIQTTCNFRLHSFPRNLETKIRTFHQDNSRSLIDVLSQSEVPVMKAKVG